MSDYNPDEVVEMEWAGVPVTNLKRELKTKFITLREARHSEVGRFKLIAKGLKPGDGVLIGPIEDEETRRKKMGRARSAMAQLKWPEGYAVGPVEENGHMFIVAMRGQKVKTNRKSHTSLEIE